MEGQQKHDIARLESRIKVLSDQLSDLSAGSGFDEMLIFIHNPGWTTIAEYQLVAGMVESMMQQAEALKAMKQVLLNGSRAVGA